MTRQAQFHAAILDPAQPAPPGLTDGQNRPAGRRFSVYRNNVTHSLTEALEQTFPVIRKLIGAEGFARLARAYLRAHPPASPVLSRYGASFPAFLDGFEPLAHLGYLGDTARLERALVDSYHAADAASLDPAVFSETAPDALPGLRLTLAPSVRLVRSAWPIHAIYRFNTEDGAPQPPATPQDVLITRPDYDPRPRLLPPGGATFVTALFQGHALGQAAGTATETAPDFDLAAALGLLLSDNALIHATLDSPE
ncbi:HvfC/BufC N-terminal domain-containing protein [Marimonas lutisalis]|uniref:HvfC/BufC N-terminal domain-containing protein n=1 Tax=Marimonas lutisalis TaxID=2545756 RepID=UPI0010F62704|nr:putative DNA-binding domain-containing protein [Marimonas lutisalis]